MDLLHELLVSAPFEPSQLDGTELSINESLEEFVQYLPMLCRVIAKNSLRNVNKKCESSITSDNSEHHIAIEFNCYADCGLLTVKTVNTTTSYAFKVADDGSIFAKTTSYNELLPVALVSGRNLEYELNKLTIFMCNTIENYR